MLSKTASPSANLIPGNTVNYVISVANNGTAPAYIAAGDPAAGNGGQLRWTTVVSLAAGSTQTFHYSTVVKTGVNMCSGVDVPNRTTIGDVVRWTITGTIPAWLAQRCRRRDCVVAALGRH